MGERLQPPYWEYVGSVERYSGAATIHSLFRNYNLTRSQNIGSLGGYPFAPYLSDGIGRRLTVFLGALIMCAGVAIQTASNSVKMFIGAR